MSGLAQSFNQEEICFISQDHYYKKMELQPVDDNGVQNFDKPESIDHEAFAQDIFRLKQGETIRKQEYTFNNPDKKPFDILFKPAPIIIAEGIFVFYFSEIAKQLDLKVFIDAREHIKLHRRIARDLEERGYPVDDVLYRYGAHVAPTYEKYIKPYKYDADIIIPNNIFFEIDQHSSGLDVLVSFLRSKL